jgi:hypothetical protein
MRGEKGGYWSRPAVASILYTPQLIKNNNKVPVLVEEDERGGHFCSTDNIFYGAHSLHITINIYKRDFFTDGWRDMRTESRTKLAGHCR